MIYSLVHRELRGRYKGSVLGFLWNFVNPLFQLIIYSVVFSGIMRVNVDKYYIFLFVTLIPWIFFSTSMTGGASVIRAQKSMVGKIYFPREVLPISFVLSCFINMLLSFIVVFAVLLFSRMKINPAALLCLPPVMGIEFILALAAAFVASSITVYFRDFEQILGILSMAWMYCTPILYDASKVPQSYQKLFALNPLAPVIVAYRDILYYGRVPNFDALAAVFGVSAVLLAASFALFKKLDRHFAEEL
jgi:ABC-2 type transport system permease protein